MSPYELHSSLPGPVSQLEPPPLSGIKETQLTQDPLVHVAVAQSGVNRWSPPGGMRL